jgi:Mrp family chromosome partitioning ATPase
MNGIETYSNIEHTVLVLSGKGGDCTLFLSLNNIGVGKSSITLQLAITLYLKGLRVGVLDIDLTGPSMPRMLGLEGRRIHQSSQGWVPVYLKGNPSEQGPLLCCMSIGFLLRDRGDSVVWRGPKKGSMIGQFVEDVVWGDLDYLLIDTPPGNNQLDISARKNAD